MNSGACIGFRREVEAYEQVIGGTYPEWRSDPGTNRRPVEEKRHEYETKNNGKDERGTA